MCYHNACVIIPITHLKTQFREDEESFYTNQFTTHLQEANCENIGLTHEYLDFTKDFNLVSTQ